MANWLIVERIDKDEWPKISDKHCHDCGCELGNKEAACLHIFFEAHPNAEFLCPACAYPKIQEDIEMLQVVLELTRRLKGKAMQNENQDEAREPQEEKEGAEEQLMEAPAKAETRELKLEEKVEGEASGEGVEETSSETEGEEKKEGERDSSEIDAGLDGDKDQSEEEGLG